jgi:hypothetical protein
LWVLIPFTFVLKNLSKHYNPGTQKSFPSHANEDTAYNDKAPYQ